MSIQIKNLSHIYAKGMPFEKVALDNINLNIEMGEFVGIIGHTGSGKTTFIQHLNGLLKPTSGQILINGIEVTGNNLKELRKQVGIVFQYPEHQLFEETVYKDIAFGLNKLGLEESEINGRIRETVKAVGLTDEVLEKSPFELSGGQKRRVAIAGVLAMKPSILVLDEPTAGLDPKGKNDILRLISKLHKDSGITILLVTHNMEDIVRLASKIVVMNKGAVAMSGSTREVFKNAQELERIGLSVPQITYFLMKLKEIVPEVDASLLTLQEAKEEIIKILNKYQ
ncbi:MAG: energy-coupling factor transporter ATPase [Clostridia bacterium]|nr:energy-coupling factor transporter ATPase [Clostridia bacterium]